MRDFIGAYLAVLAVGTSTPPAQAQACLPDHHEAEYSGGSAKLRDYICSTGDGIGLLRVTFNRIGEPLAGGLILNQPLADLRRLIGSPKLVENEISTEARFLFKNFSLDRNPSTNGWTTYVETPPQKGLGLLRPTVKVETKRQNEELEKGAFLSIPNPSWGSIEVHDDAANKIIETTDRWPDGYNFYYGRCDGIQLPVSCVQLWKYANLADLAQIGHDIRARNAAVEAELGNESSETREEVWPYEKHFALFRHLAGVGDLERFLVVQGSGTFGEIDGCTGNFSYSYAPRPFRIDFMIVENLSDTEIALNDIIGTRSPSQGLRLDTKIAATPKTPSVSLALGSQVLPPKGKIAVALRMIFADGTGLQELPYEQTGEFGFMHRNDKTSEGVWKEISALATSAILKESFASGKKTITITKVRNSYKAPTLPKIEQYLYGPEIRVAGLVVGGKPITFDGTSANFLAVTVAPPDASCPILYSWDNDHKYWLGHGKVIDQAREKSNEMTEVVPVPNGVLRFKLAEEEPEVSYIDAILLRLTLSDGRQISLAPKQSDLASPDKKYMTILAYRNAEFAFNLPVGVTSQDIAKSELAITGYYRRYSTIMAETDSRPTGRRSRGKD